MPTILEAGSLNKIETKISEVEKKTSAELVVAIARESGSYRDVDFLLGFLLSLISLAFLIFSPWVFPPLLILPFSTISFAGGVFLSPHIPQLRRLLISKERHRRQVRMGLLAAFYELGVPATKERNGMLIYISLFEDAVEILPDYGIEGRIPQAQWNDLKRRLGKPSAPGFTEDFIAALERASELLAAAFPPGETNPNEIPDRPRLV